MEPFFKKVTIVGIGLIGGSLGMVLKDKKLASQVVGVDLDQQIIDTALEVEAIDTGTTDLREGVSQADLVVLAAPVGTSITLLEKIAPFLKPGCVVTDVGSTKQEIVKAAVSVLPESITFIGGHPMAGSEQAGIAGADLYLFENAVYILTITPEIPAGFRKRLRDLCLAIGARVIEMSPAEHDFLVAGISHLPHLIAATLVNTIGGLQDQNPDILALAAGGFRDTTRIASGQPLMWRDICTTNKGNILTLIQHFKATLATLEERLQTCDGEAIEKELYKARETRKAIPVKMKGYLPALFEAVIFVPDEPGVIARVANLLGAEGININDIEILRVKEGEGGSIRLAFGTAQEQGKAMEIFRTNGIKAKTKN